MPNLKIIAACERVLFDQDGPVSLINLFQGMRFPIQGSPLPEKAVAPNHWCVFTLWEMAPEDVGKKFAQMLKVIAPDGSIFAQHEGEFEIGSAEEKQVKTKSLFTALPIWQEGTVKITACLRGSEDVFGSYNFEIVYVSKDEETQTVPGAE